MLCGREGNRRSGVALAMHHRLQWLITFELKGYEREMSTPPMLRRGMVDFTFLMARQRALDRSTWCQLTEAAASM